MLHYAILFFIVALVAALLGMRGVAGLSAEIGYVLVVVAVIFLVVAFLTGRGPVPPVGGRSLDGRRSSPAASTVSPESGHRPLSGSPRQHLFLLLPRRTELSELQLQYFGTPSRAPSGRHNDRRCAREGAGSA